MSNAPLSDHLRAQAAEYVLGTLGADERRALELQLGSNAALRAAIVQWEADLLPLASLAEPVTPSAQLWRRIARSAAGVQPVRASVWRSLSLWRALTGTSVALAALLAVVLAGRPDAGAGKPQYMVVLVAPDNKAPGYVMQASMGRELNLVPLGTASVPSDKSLQFWTKADGWRGPVSLGLVKPGQTITIPLDALPNVQPNQLFELTLEPVKGSPLNKPTGPIQFIGRAVKVM
ncbi:anti-sigma factor [Massilia sp. S19_KUP03_FR1]|uniref:anti-sigma factor n=1 Tax=Massilia sp. S19_KUP03_FR1 TaxID=3025503 RepID=UPI002FCDBE64